MEVILKPIAAAQTICGQQKKSDNNIYRKSRHCVEVNCDKGKLYFHTLTGMLVFLQDDGELEKYKEFLISNWFFVPVGFDEVAFSDKVLQIAGLLHSNKNGDTVKKSFTILPTTDCNARCCYCFEAGTRRYSMSEETAQGVSAYITCTCGGEPVELHWFGGEPLLNIQAIDLICKGLQKNEVKYNSYMISNGYYLDSKAVKKAVDLWNLKKIQITLDGTKETYERVKAYVDSDGDAYNRVLRNIENAAKAGIKVYIRLNTGAKNADEMLCLADELSARFKDKKNIVVCPSMLFDAKDASKIRGSETQMFDSIIKIKRKLRENGFAINTNQLECEFKNNNCKADNDACDIILPDGRLCRCELALEKNATAALIRKNVTHSSSNFGRNR